MDRSKTPVAEADQHDGTGAPASGDPHPHQDEPQASAPLCDWRQFHDRLRDAAVLSCRTGSPLALLLAEVRDLDQAGEAFDKALIRLFTAHVGEGGFVVRYGRGTLIAILPNSEVKDATATAEKFRHAIETLDADPIGPLAVSISGYDPHEPLGQLLQRGFRRLRATANGDL